ncbi:Transaldolase [Sphingomonas antarctica]|uniref:bifunctional transaldolase/phosoglucose isomerase n=1 Tax=Sphingomonas antarctica TaxID=2040274 RepID=UPI0039EA8BE7
MSKLADLAAAGQAVWLDNVDRNFLKAGGLRKLIAEDGLTGVTSNPAIFEKAIGSGDAYDAGLGEFLTKADASVADTFESLAIADIRAACDDLRPVYDRLEGKDGYVSLEVSPYLALETEASLFEAKKLWAAVDRPNLMIKIPGTAPGTPAIRDAIAAGINVNVTLLFSLHAYKAVAHAYLEGLEARAARGEAVTGIASVASFFVSRIDSVIDKKIDERIAAGDKDASDLKALRGQVAIANAKLAYAWYQDLIASDRWQNLAAKGVMPQRLLWASTGVKDKAYPDTLYADALIGPDTVDTIPPATMDAFRDHGTVGQTLTAEVDAARQVIADAERLGLDLAGVTAQLVVDGVKSFADAADTLYGAVAAKRAAFLGNKLATLEAHLPADLQTAVDARLKQSTADAWSRRLWAGDATLWTGKDEGKWLGWLAAARGEQVDLAALETLADEARKYPDVVLLGMGGSSLGPEVIGLILGSGRGAPRLHVLDTTDPGQIATVEGEIDAKNTLFIVSSKSGSTLEPELLRAYWFDKAGQDGTHFVAVTDPGSNLEKTAKSDSYAHIFHGDPSIGGRYSVMSVFGMVPAAASGVDVAALIANARTMATSCGPDAPPAANPGIQLGAILGEAHNAGRNKLTIVTSDALKPFGSWLEQLTAESTGKLGKGIVPIDLEPLGDPADYSADRIFVQFGVAGDADHAKLAALQAAGHPVIRVTLTDLPQIAQEFVRWEVAIAIAGAVIGIDPFDQPDVEAAKIETRELVDAYEKSGQLDLPAVGGEQGDLVVYDGDAAALGKLFDGAEYAGVLAYIERDAAHEAAIEKMRVAVRNRTKRATVAGFGPRFLHSTGQAYKGGPKGAAFLVITREPSHDLTIPDRRASFGTVERAQALGDAKVLTDRGQRVLIVHLKREDALSQLVDLVTAA